MFQQKRFSIQFEVRPFLKFLRFGFVAALLFFAKAEAQAQVFSFHGYLGQKELEPQIKALDFFYQESKPKEMVLWIDSSSGNLQDILLLAKQIHEMKSKQGFGVVAYIQNRAVGAAAILPFVADSLIVSPDAVWGDIPYGLSEKTDLSSLRKNLKSLISEKQKAQGTLERLSDAMVDPSFQIAGENSIDPLILSQPQMMQMGVAERVLSIEEFKREYSSSQTAFKRPAIMENQTLNVVSRKQFFQKIKELIPIDSKDNLFGYLRLERSRPIDASTFLYFRFAIEEYKKRKVKAIILHLDTPGGEVFSAMQIADLLQKTDINDKIPVIAYVDRWAVSAGALLAYSCRFIVSNDSSIMGAAEPVHMGEKGEMQPASEKINSALRAEFANDASFYNRNPLIAEAMVDRDLYLVLRNHEIVKIDNAEEVIHSAQDPDLIITKPGKLLTLNAEQMYDLGVSDYRIPHSDMRKIDPEMLKLEQFPATAIDLFRQPYFSTIPDAILLNFQSFKTTFFSFLTHPAVTGLLVLGLIVGFYIEIHTPGFGIFGSLALLSLCLILLGSFATQAAGFLELILLLIGVGLLLLELFVIPGFGVVGLLGIILTISGLIGLTLPNFGSLSSYDWDSMEIIGGLVLKRVGYFALAILVAVIVLIALSKIMSRKILPITKLIHQGEQNRNDGYSSFDIELPEPGSLGEASSSLRPSGKVLIGGELYNAVTEGRFIERGAPIIVVKKEASHVVVKYLDD